MLRQLTYLIMLTLVSTVAVANKTTKKKEQPKAVITRNYIDSIVVNSKNKKTVTTNPGNRNYYIERKDTVKRNPQYTRIANKYADKMGVSTQSISNMTLYSFIESWYGTRYVYGGTSRSGIDCSAFVRELYKDVFNIDLLRTSLLQYRTVRKVYTKNDLREGDLVFFNTLGRGVSHVGVYLRNGYFVHSSSSLGVGISNLQTGYWSSKYISGGRIL